MRQELQWVGRCMVWGLAIAGLASCAPEDVGRESLAVTAPGEVIARARLGNNTEDLTFIDRGRLANHVVAIDGGEVLAIPGAGRSGEVQSLFHTAGLGLGAAPRGVGFLSAERHLVLNDTTQRDRLFITDLDGALIEELAIDYAGGFVPDHVEGIAVLPASAAVSPGAIVMVGWRFSAPLEVRLLVIDRDGEVLDSIAVDPSIAGGGITAVAYAGDRFLVSPVNDQIHALDLDGSVAGDPIALDELESIEGLATVRGGLVAAGYGRGQLIGLDRRLERRPRGDRSYVIGHGFSRVGSIAWDDDSASFRVGAQIIDPSRIAALSADLETVEIVATFAESGGLLGDVAPLPGEERLAVAHAFPNAVMFVDSAGDVVEELDLGPRAPRRVVYVPATDELAMTFIGDSPALIHFFTRAGVPTRSIDLATAGVPRIAGFDIDDTGATPRLLVADGGGLVHETDLDGTLLATRDYSGSLGASFPFSDDLAVIRTGPHAGAVAFVCSDTNEVVIVSRL